MLPWLVSVDEINPVYRDICEFFGLPAKTPDDIEKYLKILESEGPDIFKRCKL